MNKDKAFKPGDYVVFDTNGYGLRKGLVVDVIETKEGKFALIEPIYQRYESRMMEKMVTVNTSKLERASAKETDRYIRMR